MKCEDCGADQAVMPDGTGIYVQKHSTRACIAALRAKLSEAETVAFNRGRDIVELRKRLTDAEERDRQMKGMLDEYRDKASVAAIILKQFRDNSGLPLERAITSGQLIGTFARLEAECKTQFDAPRKAEGEAGHSPLPSADSSTGEKAK